MGRCHGNQFFGQNGRNRPTHFHSSSWHSETDSVLFFIRPRSEGWPHYGRNFSIYLGPLSFWLTLSRGVLSAYWCLRRRNGLENRNSDFKRFNVDDLAVIVVKSLRKFTINLMNAEWAPGCRHFSFMSVSMSVLMMLRSLLLALLLMFQP